MELNARTSLRAGSNSQLGDQNRQFRRIINRIMRQPQTCREAVLEAVRAVVGEKDHNEFTTQEIVDRLQSTGTSFAESTIRTHVTSRCCRNAPKNHAVKYADFERIKPGIYRPV
jgi:hypothetical protein